MATAVNVLVLCICGQPASAPVHSDSSGHAFSAFKGHDQIRDNQVVSEVTRGDHYVVSQQRVVLIKAPAPGVDAVAKVPTPSSWRVNCLQAQLTTSAVIANRVPHLVVKDDQGNSVFNFPAGNNQVTGTVVQYSAGQSVVSQGFDNAVVLALPEPLTLLQNWTVGFLTTGLDGGDQWSAFALYVKEWLNF